MHLECLRDDVLRRIYDRLGADRPHIAKEPPAIKKEEDDAVKRESPQAPLSPPKLEQEQPKATIAVHGDANTDDAPVKRLESELLLPPKQSEEDAEPTPPAEPVAQPQQPRVVKPAKGVARRKDARRRASSAPVKAPYLDLFEANLRMADGPMAWEIKDLRQDVDGGVKTWTESASCLICNTNIE